MRLYLDDNILDKRLASLLQKAGHQVLLSNQMGMAGRSDPRHLELTIQQNLVLLTCDHDDFVDLHELIRASGGTHSGILTVRFDNDPKRDMKPRAIVAAIRKLETSGIPIANQLHVLNQWR
jgi:predicted nuclease of predicted toxin-antitoxin system